jgi:hypothetical protein
MARQGRRHADEQLLLALACGAMVQAAAQKVGLSPATVYRRLQEPDFKRRLQELRADMVQRTSGMLTAAAGEAVKTLLTLQKETTPAAVRPSPATSETAPQGVPAVTSTWPRARMSADELPTRMSNRPGSTTKPRRPTS